MDRTVEQMIEDAGWFKGSREDWARLTHEQREDIAFAGCGCAVAYPTWEGPVDCVHPGCQIRRGEKQPIYLTDCILRGEMDNGWLRFDKATKAGRIRLARLVRAIRRKARETGIYDPWKMEGGWQVMVGSAINV
jgi:hypothetical protein